MEYGFRIADIFPGEISLVSSSLIPDGCPGLNKLGPQTVKQYVAEILDTMGRASASAQNLHHIITSSAKLRESDGEQTVYVMCDLAQNQVVGLLKIGRKKLFIFDQGGQQHELSPMCILDFYVHESRQRAGCGHHIFECMLRKEGVEVRHLAIDHPSDKFLFFFRKYYNLTQIIPQVNNFVVFDGFLTGRPDYAGKKKRWTGLDQVDSESPTERTKRENGRTMLEDSRNYNRAPGLFLRNPGAGSMVGYSHVQNRHDSYGGPAGPAVLQAPNGQNGAGIQHPAPFYRSANNITPNYQSNGGLHQQRLYSKPEIAIPISSSRHHQKQAYPYHPPQQQQQPQQNFRDLKYTHEPLW